MNKTKDKYQLKFLLVLICSNHVERDRRNIGISQYLKMTHITISLIKVTIKLTKVVLKLLKLKSICLDFYLLPYSDSWPKKTIDAS